MQSFLIETDGLVRLRDLRIRPKTTFFAERCRSLRRGS